MLVSCNRDPKYMLVRGERKSLQSDHVILVPGPDNEVNCVCDIFRMFTHEHKWPAAIAAELRRQGVAYHGTKRTAWYAEAVNRVLKNPKYCGCSVFGRSTFRLHTRRTFNPRGLWTVTKGAWRESLTKRRLTKPRTSFKTRPFIKRTRICYPACGVCSRSTDQYQKSYSMSRAICRRPNPMCEDSAAFRKPLRKSAILDRNWRRPELSAVCVPCAHRSCVRSSPPIRPA
jgi:hypothetical protein